MLGILRLISLLVLLLCVSGFSECYKPVTKSEREGADAVIDGIVKSFGFSGVLLDDKGRARIFEVTITAAVTVRDQHENRVLYDNQNFVFRGEFEFANDPRNFFNEEDPAVHRMARNFAESIVSTLINGFGVKE